MEIEIPQNHELRLEIDSQIRVMVLNGLAEIKGHELLNEKWYTLSNIKTFIFTFTGAKIKMEGVPSLYYVSRRSITPNIFNYFDTLIKENKKKNILVLGKGRSTFCSTLINFFVRYHKRIKYCEIDLNKGNVFPACLSLVEVSELIDYRDKYPLKNVKSFFHGTTEIKNWDLYYMQLDKIANAMRSDDMINVVLCDNFGMNNLDKIIDKLEINDICIVGDERMYNVVSHKVKYFFENTGYINDNDIYKSINRYFNGIENEYTSSTFIVKYNWTVMRLGEEYMAPTSALPLGSTRKISTAAASKTTLEENSILAISEAKTEDEVATAPVVGFIVCLDPERFKVLCTQGKLPKLNYLIQSDIKYVDY